MEDPDLEKIKTQLFRIKIQAKKIRIDSIFDPSSQVNLITEKVVTQLGLEIYNHPKSYPLGWVNSETKLYVTK